MERYRHMNVHVHVLVHQLTSGFISGLDKRIVANFREGATTCLNIGKPISKGGGGESTPCPPEIDPVTCTCTL